MGRGYSANRSSSKRLTNKFKRGLNTETIKEIRSNSTKEFKKRAREEIESDVEEIEEVLLDELEEETIRSPEVLNKYYLGGKVVDHVLEFVSSKCVPGANTMNLCKEGDLEILNKTKELYKNAKTLSSEIDGEEIEDQGKRGVSCGNSRPRSMCKKTIRGRSRSSSVWQQRAPSRASSRRGLAQQPLSITFTEGVPRGIAYPTTVSVNEVLCNHSPFSEEDGTILKVGDIVKIHCGVHVDGFPVMAATTIIVRPFSDDDINMNKKLSVSAFNAIEAARIAVSAVVHAINPGISSADLTDLISRIGNYYNTEAIEGVLSTRLKRWVLDSVSHTFICRRVTEESPHQDVADCRLEPFQVWSVDVAFTNCPTYKTQIGGNKSNIFRKNEIIKDSEYEDMRLRAASELLDNEVRFKFHNFAFTALHCEDPLRTRLALGMMTKKGLFDEFPELKCKLLSVSKKEREQPISSRFMCTVALSENKLHVFCGGQGTVIDFIPAEKFYGNSIPSKNSVESHMDIEDEQPDSADAIAYNTVNNMVPYRLKPEEKIMGLIMKSLSYATKKEKKKTKVELPLDKKQSTMSKHKLELLHPDKQNEKRKSKREF